MPDALESFSAEELRLQRRLLTLSFIAYCGVLDNDSDDLVDLVQKGLDKVRDDIGEHELVWGPAHVRPVGRPFDNGMMMVVRPATDPGRLAVVIRGTNPVSMSAWLQQDLNVMRSTPWVAPGATDDACYSVGVSKSLWLLTAALMPNDMAPGDGLTLLQWLEREVSGQQEVSIDVTGHSLGGVMATTLALWLRERLPAEQVRHLHTRAFAGPSAGNQAFADYTDRMLGHDYLRIHNHRDIVAHAWNTDDILELKELYHHCLDHYTLDRLADELAGMVADQGYTQLARHRRLDPGPFKPLPLWGMQAVYQHVVPYLEAYDLDVLKILRIIGFHQLAWSGFDPTLFMKLAF